MHVKGPESAVRYNQAANVAVLDSALTLTATCAYFQIVSASSPQNIHLPSGVPAGWSVRILNDGAVDLSVLNASGTLVKLLEPGKSCTCIEPGS